MGMHTVCIFDLWPIHNMICPLIVVCILQVWSICFVGQKGLHMHFMCVVPPILCQHVFYPSTHVLMPTCIAHMWFIHQKCILHNANMHFMMGMDTMHVGIM
jgi:hypothetical protein